MYNTHASRLRLFRPFALAALALTAVGSAGAVQAASSDPQVTVTIGSTRCFVVRRPDGPSTAQDRVIWVHEVFARHLGSPNAQFTLRKLSAKATAGVEILLNGDPVIHVTSNDARATGYTKAEEVAVLWKKTLERAFNDTHARKESQSK